jgi:hypothetical protein
VRTGIFEKHLPFYTPNRYYCNPLKGVVLELVGSGTHFNRSFPGCPITFATSASWRFINMKAQDVDWAIPCVQIEEQLRPRCIIQALLLASARARV